jgi:hypothetical protein
MKKIAKALFAQLIRASKNAPAVDANVARKMAIRQARGVERLLEDRQPAHKRRIT